MKSTTLRVMPFGEYQILNEPGLQLEAVSSVHPSLPSEVEIKTKMIIILPILILSLVKRERS